MSVFVCLSRRSVGEVRMEVFGFGFWGSGWVRFGWKLRERFEGL